MSTSVVTIGVLSSLVSISITATSGGALLASREALHGAADASALAAADTLFGLVDGDPCARAAALAEHNGASLTFCEVQETAVTVRVERRLLGMPVGSSARAGLGE